MLAVWPWPCDLKIIKHYSLSKDNHYTSLATLNQTGLGHFVQISAVWPWPSSMRPEINRQHLLSRGIYYKFDNCEAKGYRAWPTDRLTGAKQYAPSLKNFWIYTCTKYKCNKIILRCTKQGNVTHGNSSIHNNALLYDMHNVTVLSHPN